MAKKVGRPRKPFVQTQYTEADLKTILKALKKSSDTKLVAKVKYDLKERKRLQKAYQKAKLKMFGS